MQRNPAEVLGIMPFASQEEARKAYRALARRWHPDRFMPGPEREWANEKMTEINTAYAEFTKNAKNRAAAGIPDLSKVEALIDDGRLTMARELLMTMTTRCAEWNYLFGQLLFKLADYKKAQMYLSVAAHQDPDNRKYAHACAEVHKKLIFRRPRIFGGR